MDAMIKAPETHKKFFFKKPVEKILIIKPSSLGDIVHSLPFLNAVRKKFSAARIDWVVARGLHTFLTGHPMIDRLLIMDKDKWKRLNNLGGTVREIYGFCRELGSRNYDLALDLSGLLRSGLICLASRAERKIGFMESDEGSPWFYTDRIKGGTEIHAIDRYLRIARYIGCPDEKPEYPFAPFDENPDILKSLPQKYAVMAPSAGKDANRWPAERFGELAALLPAPSVVISGASDMEIAESVEKNSRGRAVSIAGRTSLKELAAIIKKAEFFISNDTGPMHIAAAFNVPVFAIFGPANPVRTGPYGTGHTIIKKELDCAPCYAHKPCSRWKWRCMNELGVEEVFEIISGKI